MFHYQLFVNYIEFICIFYIKIFGSWEYLYYLCITKENYAGVDIPD